MTQLPANPLLLTKHMRTVTPPPSPKKIGPICRNSRRKVCRKDRDRRCRVGLVPTFRTRSNQKRNERVDDRLPKARSQHRPKTTTTPSGVFGIPRPRKPDRCETKETNH